MKAIGWKGLVALAALLVVPLTATPVSAETGTWFCNAAGGVEIITVFEVPCDVLNAQLGSTIDLTDHVVMGIRLRNMTGTDDYLTTLRIQSRNTKADLIDNMKIYQESGVGTPSGPEDFDSGTDTQVGSTVDLSADPFWDQNGSAAPPPTAAAEFDFGAPGLLIEADEGEINLYVVIEFRNTILGDAALVNAGVGVAMDGALPSIEVTTAGDGPVDDDGPAGTAEIVVNDPLYVNRLETRSPQFDFAIPADLTPNPVYLGKWDIPSRAVVGPDAGSNLVVMGLWFDNTHGGIQDAITAVKLRSRVGDDFALSRVAIYRETDCIVPVDRFSFSPSTDQLWFVNLNPGAFSWNKNQVPDEDEGMPVTMNFVANPGAGVIPVDGLVYLYVVVDLDPVVIKTDMDSRERYTDVEVGIALNDATPGTLIPEAFTMQTGVKGPRELVGDDAELVHNEMTAPDDIFNWDSGDPAESGGQPWIIDALPPEIICLTFGPGATDWTHADWPIGEQTLGADGNEVVDNYDELIVRAVITDPGPANLVDTGNNRPRVDMKPFGMNPPTTNNLTLMEPEPGNVWKASANDGTLDFIADGDTPAQRTDTSSGQLFLLFRATDDAGNTGEKLCPVNKPVDTRRPSFSGVPVTFDFAPGGDLNGDGIAGIGDIIRMTVNMHAHWYNWNQPGQPKEIQSLVADLTSWDVLPGEYDPILGQTWDGYVELLDPSGDNQFFSRDFTVLQGTHNGIPALSQDSKAILTAIDNANNPRVSDDKFFARELDNQPPIPAPAMWTLLTDSPDNNIINIGDVVRFSADLSDPDNDDVATVELNLFEAGLGGQNQAFLTDPNHDGIYTLDWTVLNPILNNSQAWDRDEDPKVDVCPIPAVPIGNGERYSIDMLITDEAGNTFTATLGDPAFPHLDGNPLIQVSVDTRVPEPVANLTAEAIAGGVLELNWDNPSDGTDPTDTKDGPLTFEIYWDAGTGGAADDFLAVVFENTALGCDATTSWNTDQTVQSQNLTCGHLYKFSIVVRDNANNPSVRSLEAGAITDCYAPEMCVFEPEAGGLYSAASGLTIFVQPVADDRTLPENEDVQSVRIRARLQDSGDGPGEWQWVSDWVSQSNNDLFFEVELDEDAINSLFSTCGEGVVEFIVRTQDAAGNENTDEEAMGDCSPMFWVNWSYSSVDGRIVTINDDFLAPQPRCDDAMGFKVEGTTNTVDVCAACGTEPYKVQAWVKYPSAPKSAGMSALVSYDSTIIYYSEGLDSCSSFNVDVTNFQGDLKGANQLVVHWIDATGDEDWATVMICVPDIIAPCARIVNPVDGKCINIAQTMINPIPLDVCLNTIPGEVCVDQEDVLKIEFQWSDYCCVGNITKDSSFFRWQDCTGGGGPEGVCDTFPVGAIGFAIDSVVCVDTAATCSLLVRVDTTFTVPCDEDWTVIDDISGGDLKSDCGHYDWWNTEALAGYESGDVIYLRGVVYDVVGNIFYTPCVQVCLDREAPPMCIWTPDTCGTFEGNPKVRGEISVVGELNLAQGQIDDIATVDLWYKLHNDPDIPSSWTKPFGSGFITVGGGTNSTVWRWNINTDGQLFDQNEVYDFRVIPTTVTNRVAWDADGDGMFDAYTFNADSCDMATWFVDNLAPQVAIDTATTMINGVEVNIPVPSCTLSDPKGWIWGQYGQPITVEATAYPLGDIGDIWKVRWTLYDEAATCACSVDQGDPLSTSHFASHDADSWILGERFGTNWDDFRSITFNAADYVPVQDGYWNGVLYVELWDSCGNKSTDCVEVFILDAKPTDAIVYAPKNDAVVCGEVLLEARSLMRETIDKVTFYYEQDGDTVTIGDGVSVTPSWRNAWQYTWVTDDGNLHPGEFTVWAIATDQALNKQETIYPKTLYLSCAKPTVQLLTPVAFDETEGNFLGACDIEVTATASTPDVIYNPVVKVCFYYHEWLQPLSYDSDHLIGCDEFSTTTTFGLTWNPSDDLDVDGKYYIDAVATNKAGQTTISDPVLVHFDDASPYAKVIEVNGDGTDGGQLDPTVISIGNLVNIYAFAGDSLARHGVGGFDNCGVDSVIFYVRDASENVFGSYLMGVDREIDSLFLGQWPTATFGPGDYRIRVRAFDCACHSSYSADWYVRLVGAAPGGTLAIDAPDVCGYPSVVDYACFTFAPDAGVVNPTVKIYVSNAISDVYDQYTLLPGNMQYDSDDGLYHWCGELPAGFDTEGLYMVRADIRTVAGSNIIVVDDYDGDGKFDDFSFNVSKPHCIYVRVDQSATPFTVSLDKATIKAHSTVEVTVTPNEACDVDEVCYGLVAENGYEALGYCFSDLVYDLDPIDSGFVSLNNGIWGGQVRVRVTDPLGNERIEYSADELWVLDISDNGAMVIEPRWGEYVTGDAATLTARKLTSGTVTNLQFFYGGATGSGTQIAGTVTTAGDEFYITWDISNPAVPEGELYLWTSASTDKRIRVIVSKGVTGIVLKDPAPNFKRTVGNSTFTFVGAHVDLCLDRDSLSSFINGIGIDSVVFAYRRGDAPGVPYEPYADEGWVPIATDQYGSLCVDWFTPCNPPGCSDLDGSYAIAAWVYDRAGSVDHSNIVQVMVDCSPAHTEIVDIDGDETFEECHQIELTGADPRVKFSAVAIDDCPCAGPDEGKNYLMCNSGARYLQFYVGGCGDQVLGKVDIVWVIDGSGSMGSYQAAIASGAQDFFNGLAGADFRLGVLGFGGVQCGDTPFIMAGDGTAGPAGGPGQGEWTRDASAFGLMATGIGSGHGGMEEGLIGITEALNWYDFRRDALKVVILVTDEGADEVTDCGGSVQDYLPGIIASNATVHTVLSTEITGYENLASSTGGVTFNITSSWGSTLAALASDISAEARTGNGADVGIIWGEQIDLTDGDQYPNNPFAYWDPSGVPDGEYCAWTVVIDEVGNTYTSEPVSVCIEDTKAPIGEIAGFGYGKSCCDSSYTMYGRSCDEDIAWVQFQYRRTSSTVQTDWTAIGLASQVDADPTLWVTTWNPCLLSGNYDLRMVPTDINGNEDFSKQPIVHVSINNCTVAMAGASITSATVGFEDKTFDNLGLVNVENADPINCHTMVAVYADLNNGLDVEKVDLWQDYDNTRHYMGSFDDASILNGGKGWFWAGMTDNSTNPPTTKLTRGILTVYHVEADLGFPGCVSDASIGAKVCIQPGALSATNGVVLFPARFPTLSLTQQHIQAWPNANGISATAIRLTSPIYSFNTGKYAEVKISYDQAAVTAAGLSNSDLTIGWWDGDEWNITDGMIAGGEIAGGVAEFYTTNLHGLYAVLSAGRECNSGALTVEIQPFPHGFAGPKPTFRATVKSKVEFANNNDDIAEDMITVMLDGKTILARGDGDDDGLDWHWSDVSGDLAIWWEADWTQALTDGQHTLSVQAFNRTGYCQSDEYTFTVDATEPDVAVEGGYICPNPTFTFTITDNGSGVNWDSVYVDVYEWTPSEPDQILRKDRLIHTETPDAWLDGAKVGNEVSFSLTLEQAQYDGFHIIIYNGDSSLEWYDDCSCEKYYYDHDSDGVPDMAGNATEIVEEWYTVNSASADCAGTYEPGTGPEVDKNPFDPFAGEVAVIALNGFQAGGGKVEATVYDLTGERVATLDASGGSVVWDGRTYHGDVVAEGVYLIHFQRVGGAAGYGATSMAMKVVVKRAD